MAEEKKYRKGRPGNRILNCSLTVEEIAQIDYAIENNKWIYTRRHFFETAILELLKQQPEVPEEYLENHAQKDIKEDIKIRPKSLNCKLTPIEIAKIDFVVENNKWVHNRSQFLEVAILDLLNKELEEPTEQKQTRIYRKGREDIKGIACRITEEEAEAISEYITKNDWIPSRSQFLEIAITELLKEELPRIEKEGTKFVFKEYKNYK